MRTIATVILFGAALVGAPRLDALDPGVAAVITLAVAVTLAGLAADGFSPAAIACGALGGLAFTALSPTAPELAGATALLGCFGARALRAPSARVGLIHVLSTLACGAAAASIAVMYASGAPSVRAAAALVAGVLCAIPLAVPADDAVAHALTGLARNAEGSARLALTRAAALRRRAVDESDALPERTTRRLERAWDSLLEAGRARVAARGTGTAVLEQRILSHVEALEQLYSAAGERVARAAGLSDVATLADARMEGDALAAEATALAEVTPAPAGSTTSTATTRD